jgi:mycothiol synthase
MQIKKFSEDLLKPAAKLCRQNMTRDIMPDFLLREKTFGDPDYRDDLTLFAYSDDPESPAAFIQAVIRNRTEGKIGYIKLLCVDSNLRRKGIASELYKNIEEKFQKNNVKKIRVYESFPNYFMPGIDPFYTEAICFFERNGFKKFNDTSNLSVDLLEKSFQTLADEEKLKKEKIIFKKAESSEKSEILKWVEINFPAWEGEVSEAMKNDPPTLYICIHDDKIKAFSAYEANNRGTGWFGPMATDPSLRGKGIGGILLKNACRK